jgi:hypothetical protein
MRRTVRRPDRMPSIQLADEYVATGKVDLQTAIG